MNQDLVRRCSGEHDKVGRHLVLFVPQHSDSADRLATATQATNHTLAHQEFHIQKENIQIKQKRTSIERERAVWL